MKKLFMFFIAIALIAAFSVPAAADDAEWNFYGSARMATFSVDQSKEINAGKHDPAADDRDTTWDLQGNSRIGANVSAGDVGGRFEYGTKVNLRLLYGTWNFGAGQLLIGQGYTPINMIQSNQVYATDNDLVGYGSLFSRKPMIQVKFGDFKVALVTPSTAGSDEVEDPAGGEEVDTTLPKIELAYMFKTDMFRVGVRGGYNSYEVEGDSKTYDVDSWVAALWGAVNLGPAYIKANVYQAQNQDNYGLPNGGYGAAVFDSGKVKDTDTLGYCAIAGVKLSDAFAIEAGYGAVSNEYDITGSKDDDATTMYVQATIGLAPGVFIVPEIGKIDNKKGYDATDTYVKQGDTTYFGAKWQINF